MKNIVYNKYLQYTILLFSVLFTFLFVFLGESNNSDFYYWLNMYVNRDLQTMTFGSVLISHWYGNFFGFTVFSFRFLAWLLCVISLLMPFFFIIPRVERRNHIYSLSISFFMLGYGCFQELSPGTYSVFFISLYICLLWKYYCSQSIVYLTFMSIVSTIAVICRFPNILLIPATSFFIVNYYLCYNKSKIVIYHAVIYTVITLLFVAFCYLMSELLFHNFSRNIALEINSGSHGIKSLIHLLYANVKHIIFYTSIIFVYLYFLFDVKIDTVWKSALYNLLLVVVFVILFFTELKMHRRYNMNLHYFISSISIATVIFYIFYYKTHDVKKLCLSIIILLVGSIVPMGSDTHWLKLFPILLCFLPVLCWLVQMPIITSVRNIYSVIFVFLVFCVGTYVINPIDGVPLYKNVILCKDGLLKYTFQQQITCDKIKQMQQSFLQYGIKSNSIAYGWGAHMFNCINDLKRAPYQNFWCEFNDSVFIENNKKYIVRHRPIVFCIDEDAGHTLFDDMMRELSYKMVVIDKCFMVYLPLH